MRTTRLDFFATINQKAQDARLFFFFFLLRAPLTEMTVNDTASSSQLLFPRIRSREAILAAPPLNVLGLPGLVFHSQI